jgi:hypothetical protein
MDNRPPPIEQIPDLPLDIGIEECRGQSVRREIFAWKSGYAPGRRAPVAGGDCTGGWWYRTAAGRDPLSDRRRRVLDGTRTKGHSEMGQYSASRLARARVASQVGCTQSIRKRKFDRGLHSRCLAFQAQAMA